MMAAGTKALLRAIEGFSGAHAGNPDHEGTIELLSRVKGEIAKGRGPAPDSPGRSEALGASQRNHPSEQDHLGSEGNRISNRPGNVNPHDETPDMHADSHPGPDNRLTGAGPVHTDGHRTSNLPGPSANAASPHFALRAAAGEKARFSAGNRRSNREAPPARPGSQIGHAEIRSATTPEKPTSLAGAEIHGQGESPFKRTNEVPVGGSRFERAAAQAKARLKATR